ncbi:hypothetical protein M433DRAFT_102248 [Acidomyces richmondensis BFW]|nr:MAG: hypothetical protein FE78DRAFT_161918 [Acidomyces sp. 'richmondensis']KYG48666.1 hypothetical protein M433DRAFT_102248 [Acidomyces richmondensis BFW]
MADRFPSLEEFDAGQIEPHGGASQGVPDSSAEPSDFLARERAALGDDAGQFATPEDARIATVADGEGDDGDLLGGGGGASAGANGMMGDDNDDMMGEFTSSFPAVDTSNDAVAPGGTITNISLPTTPYPAAADEDEPEVLRSWRERRALAIQHRDEVSAAKKAETIKAAQEAVDEFYENYNNRKDKQIAQTRREAEEFLAKREDTTSGGTAWERIGKLIDLSGKGAAGGAPGTGKARMRELLMSLRKDPGAPGAGGV